MSVFLCAETCIAEIQSEKAGKSMKIELPVFLVQEEDMFKRALQSYRDILILCIAASVIGVIVGMLVPPGANTPLYSTRYLRQLHDCEASRSPLRRRFTVAHLTQISGTIYRRIYAGRHLLYKSTVYGKGEIGYEKEIIEFIYGCMYGFTAGCMRRAESR